MAGRVGSHMEPSGQGVEAQSRQESRPIMQRIDTQHHTPEQVLGYLREATEIMGEFNGHEATWTPIFLKVVDLLSEKSVALVPPQSVQPPAMAIPRGGRH